MSNDFLPFCPDDTGTNLISQSDYAVASQRTIGNQPGIASAKLNNKALRQGTAVASAFAQFVANQAVVSTVDDDTPDKLLSQIAAAVQPMAPVLQSMLSGTGTWNATFYFFCASANATINATYTNNGVTYTVSSTISSGTVLKASGNGSPTANGGTLTKASGTGDATIVFYASRAPISIDVELVGGGGGGGGGGFGSGAGQPGTATTFGSSLLNGGLGSGGANGGGGAPAAGGPASLGSGPIGIAIVGGTGSGAGGVASGGLNTGGGSGGSSPFGGSGGGQGALDTGGSQGADASTNSGSGGGGGFSQTVSNQGGDGGGAGGWLSATITSPNFSYGWVVGIGGTGGSPGTGSSGSGGAGGSGAIIVKANYQ